MNSRQGKRADLTEIQRLIEYNRTHRVGVPSEGEEVCPICMGHGQSDQCIPAGRFMGGQCAPCEHCFGTGCVKVRGEA